MQLQEALLFGIAAMVLHEAGHVVAALALNVKVHKVGLHWKGPYIRRSSGTAAQNFVITLAGPGMNLWLALLFYRASPHFALCNLVIGVVNLMPIPASDGSRALQLISQWAGLREFFPRIQRQWLVLRRNNTFSKASQCFFDLAVTGSIRWIQDID
jgi:Zn-dependent protease